MKKWTSFIITASILVVGCKKDGVANIPVEKPVEMVKLAPGEEKQLFPIKVGNKWTYAYQARNVTGGKDQTTPQNEVTFTIVRTEDVPEGKKVFWEVTSGGRLNDKQIWLVCDKGYFQLGVGFPNFRYFSTPQPIIVFPIKEDSSFRWEGSGILSNGQVGKMEIVSKILSNQEVDTDMGRMSAIPVESTQTFTSVARSGTGVSTVYIAPKIGIIRFKQQEVTASNAAVQVLKLKSTNVK